MNKLYYTKTNNLSFKISSGKKNNINTIQFRFGGYMEGKPEEFKTGIRRLLYNIRQLIYKRSSDGYYKKRFLFIEEPNISIYKTGKGIMFVDVFLFLEEEYEKKFVLQYLMTLFSDIDRIYSENKHFKTKPYKDAKIKTEKRPQEKSSTKEQKNRITV